jgi:hypothetical protein
MKPLASQSSIIDLQSFIKATRDSGYKGLSSALSELIDNSFEANATQINVSITEDADKITGNGNVAVCDNGTGMTSPVLQLALKFGGSTKFNSRDGLGRYGMGLPNSSLSQARRVDVYTWTKPGSVLWTYLDVDEIGSGRITEIPKPKAIRFPIVNSPIDKLHGTLVVWSKGDRIRYKRTNTFTSRLHADLGRRFREFLWAGKIIRINGEEVKPVDPLFMREGANLLGARPYGPPLSYEIRLPFNSKQEATSKVLVRFVELPIEKWFILSNEEKRAYGIANGAGMSILRAGREIDYGWFFAGKKRKENYDDWWRCEIHFEPNLDEIFGITHTKQGIHPSETIINLLSPDIERIAHKLNSRVRTKFISVRMNTGELRSERRAAQFDSRLEPPIPSTNVLQKGRGRIYDISNRHRISLPGLRYKIRLSKLESLSFFQSAVKRGILVLDLNEEHPFFRKIYRPLISSEDQQTKVFRDNLELLLLALGRAEQTLKKGGKKRLIDQLRDVWSNNLGTFLTS